MTLQAVLAELYSEPASIKRLATEAGIDVARIAWTQPAVNIWTAVIEEARRQSRLTALAAIVNHEYPTYEPLQLALVTAGETSAVAHDPLPVRVGRLEQRVDGHESTLRHILEAIDPGPRRRTAMALFWGILITLWSSWLIYDIREWYISNPVQAIGITLAAIIAAFVVRWLPEADRGNER